MLRFLFFLNGLAMAEFPDISSVEPDLTVSEMAVGQPEPGRRVKQTLPDYLNTGAYHTLYLPPDWKPGGKYPVLIEYAGNGPYKSKYGDVSTGRVEHSRLGYGISAGKGFIWVCMPYLDNDGKANVTRWWGNAPEWNPGATVDYCKKAVPYICKEFGGDPARVILCGFSRGAIACNFIGLDNDEIAKLWRAFIAYSHYDGVRPWEYRNSDRRSALDRLKRLKGRPQFICHESGTDPRIDVSATRRFLEASGTKAQFNFIETGFRNHNDAWILRPSPARKALREWLKKVIDE
tara:strand:+ start:67 stop:939 length:873 start_codon:yes stop_codon:yes gene_type:complete